ncbi:hypothetical protein D4R99_01045 [bacterium]|nr:MAG: hypothetical protein D4R99_01045 [bacterium]
MDKETAARAHVIKHRALLQKAARNAYAFFRFAVTFFGISLAVLYGLTPHIGVILVPDFVLAVFTILLTFLLLSEILFRMVRYSSDVYCEDDPCEKGEKCTEEKPSALARFALNFPFRGLHLFLMGIWFFLSLHYLIFSAVVASSGSEMIFPENFLLSFYIVSGACALDFLAKGIFIFRLPEIGKFVKEVAVAVLQTNEGTVVSFISKAFQLIFRK